MPTHDRVSLSAYVIAETGHVLTHLWVRGSAKVWSLAGQMGTHSLVELSAKVF